MRENDFGFSIVSEEELRTHEEELKLQVLNENKRLIKLRDMIMPLLKNLCENEEKEYIYWPNRKEKIEKFIENINKIVDSE